MFKDISNRVLFCTPSHETAHAAIKASQKRKKSQAIKPREFHGHGRTTDGGRSRERTDADGGSPTHPRKGAIRELEIVNRPGHERSNDQPTTKEQLAAAMRIHCITTLCTTRITGMACTRPIGHCQGWDRRVIGDRTHSDTKDIGEQVSTACIIQSLAILG